MAAALRRLMTEKTHDLRRLMGGFAEEETAIPAFHVKRSLFDV
jgi:hypothetical protein